MASIFAIKAEATAVCKGVEMNHGNSFHYVTFELDSGERIYFQVSMKSYMLIVEGDRCLIKYKSLTNSALKKLKSFERIRNVAQPSVQRSVVAHEPDTLSPVLQQRFEEIEEPADDEMEELVETSNVATEIITIEQEKMAEVMENQVESPTEPAHEKEVVPAKRSSKQQGQQKQETSSKQNQQKKQSSSNRNSPNKKQNRKK